MQIKKLKKRFFCQNFGKETKTIYINRKRSSALTKNAKRRLQSCFHLLPVCPTLVSLNHSFAMQHLLLLLRLLLAAATHADETRYEKKTQISLKCSHISRLKQKDISAKVKEDIQSSTLPTNHSSSLCTEKEILIKSDDDTAANKAKKKRTHHQS